MVDDIIETAPPGAKYERMVRHIKGPHPTKTQKRIAFATAWKQYDKTHDESVTIVNEPVAEPVAPNAVAEAKLRTKIIINPTLKEGVVGADSGPSPSKDDGKAVSDPFGVIGNRKASYQLKDLAYKLIAARLMEKQPEVVEGDLIDKSSFFKGKTSVNKGAGADPKGSGKQQGDYMRGRKAAQKPKLTFVMQNNEEFIDENWLERNARAAWGDEWKAVISRGTGKTISQVEQWAKDEPKKKPVKKVPEKTNEEAR